MLLGIVYSFKRVFDPIIIEEERRNNETSGELLVQAEQFISNQENRNTRLIDQGIEQVQQSIKEAMKARFVSDVLFSNGSLNRPDSSQLNSLEHNLFRAAAFGDDRQTNIYNTFVRPNLLQNHHYTTEIPAN